MAGKRPERGEVYLRPLETLDTSTALVWDRDADVKGVGLKCGYCGGTGIEGARQAGFQVITCSHCRGDGWFGISSRSRTTAMPGSDVRIAVMQVRYNQQQPLWHPDDVVDFRDGMPVEDYPRPQRGKAKLFSDEIWDRRGKNSWERRNRARRLSKTS